MRYEYLSPVIVGRFLLALLLVLLTALSAEAQCTPQQIHKLLPTGGSAGSNFGNSVALDGTTAVVGEFQRNSVYLFHIGTGQQFARLLAGDAAGSFGQSVGISDGIVIVGSPCDDDNGNCSGSASLFDVTTGQRSAKLRPSGIEEEDHCGWSVAIGETTAIVGSPGDDDNGSGAGAAYLFSTGGVEIAKLLPSDGRLFDLFGDSVAIDGNLAIIGAPGEFCPTVEVPGTAYVFDITTRQQIARLIASDPANCDRFGDAVAISGNIAIVGAPWNDDNGDESGSAYLFDVVTGQQLAKLLPSDGAREDYFGAHVAIRGGLAAVGATFHDGVGQDSGAVYMFDVATGMQLSKIVPADNGRDNNFGHGVTVRGNVLLVGADGDDDNGPASGSAYLFAICETETCADGGVLIKGTGQTNDFNATCGSDDVYWGAHGSTLFYQLTDPATQFELTATAPAEFLGGSIWIEIEASKQNSSANLTLFAFLFNYSTGSYETLPSIMPLGTTDVVETFDLPAGADPNDFIEPGTNDVKLLIITIQTSGLPNVRTQLDEVLFNFE